MQGTDTYYETAFNEPSEDDTDTPRFSFVRYGVQYGELRSLQVKKVY